MKAITFCFDEYSAKNTLDVLTAFDFITTDIQIDVSHLLHLLCNEYKESFWKYIPTTYQQGFVGIFVFDTHIA